MVPTGYTYAIQFGQSVAVDGEWIAVGDTNEVVAPFNTGRVDVWRYQASAWQHEGSVTGLPACSFGASLAIEGDDLIVGQQCGERIYHFRHVGGVWTLQHATPQQPNTSVVQARAMALDGVGCPRVGQPYSVALTGGLGGSFAVLAVGDAPAQFGVFGGTLWTAPILLTVGAGLSGSPGAARDGGFQLPIPLASPSLAGTRLCFQAGVLDPAAAQLFALGNGLEIVVAS